ncbi:MAG: hypothetical protein RLW61_16175 [Gammaproteobacteria bacterium]
MRHLSLTLTWTLGLSALMASLCLANPLPWLLAGLALIGAAGVMLVRELSRIAARSRREPTLAELGLAGRETVASPGDTSRRSLDGLPGTFARS